MAAQKRILVTGATGFVGKNLIPRLDEKGYQIFPVAKSIGYDLNDNSCFHSFQNEGIDVVIHLAGRTFVPESWNDSTSFYEINSLGTQRVLEFCCKSNIKLVYVSAYVYGIPQYLPINELHPVVPNNPYAHSKWLGEELCRFYSRELGVKTVILRPFNLYGPGQTDNFLIPMLIKQIKENKEIIVQDETPKRDYLHISDFVEACIETIDFEESFKIFNVGSEASFSVQEIIEIFTNNYNNRIKWRSLGEKRHNEISETISDCTAIKQCLGWSPKISFPKSLICLINNDRENYETG
jgi:UDP-glucose 4-epimerase